MYVPEGTVLHPD